MFSHLCRGCLNRIIDHSDAVPLFESYKNISYHRLCGKLGLSVDKDDNLATHLCKKCATEILQSYKFRLMYMESDKKLREMLGQRTASKKEPNKPKNLVGTEETKKSFSAAPNSSNGRWKCKTCSAGFTSRARLQQHNKSHRSNDTTDPEQKLWSCTHCSAKFRSRKLKNEHQQEHNGNTILNISVEPSVVIDIDDDEDEYEYDYDPKPSNEFNDLHFADTTQVGDDNSADESYLTTDLGLYLIQKNSQLNCFDPLEGDNSTGGGMHGLFEPSGSHLKEENCSTPNEKWKCSLCSKYFRTRDLLSEHKQLHKGAKEGAKHEIKKIKNGRVKNKDEDDAKPATKKLSGDAELRWKCKTCSKAFPTRELLRIHRRTHSTKTIQFEGYPGADHSKATENFNGDVDVDEVQKKKKKIEL